MLSGHIDCMRYRLLRSIMSVSQSVCLSCNFTWHRCANTAEQIKALLGVKACGPKEHSMDESTDFLFGSDAAIAKLLWPLVAAVLTH